MWPRRTSGRACSPIDVYKRQGLDGLVHISQCALTRIAKVEDAVNVGDIVRVKVLDVNTEAKRISLSIREVLEDEALDSVPEADEFAFDDDQI